MPKTDYIKAVFVSTVYTGLLCIQFASCASAGKVKQYKFSTELAGTTREYVLSGEPIDRGDTYRVFFTLSQQEECIRISINAKEIYKDFRFVENHPRIYFIIERAVDIRKFRQKDRDFIFSELAANYTSNWEHLEYLLLCGAREGPLKILAPGTYRLRFSSLGGEKFSYTIKIESDNAPVVFSEIFSAE